MDDGELPEGMFRAGYAAGCADGLMGAERFAGRIGDEGGARMFHARAVEHMRSAVHRLRRPEGKGIPLPPFVRNKPNRLVAEVIQEDRPPAP